MKKILVITGLIMTLLLVACSPADDKMADGKMMSEEKTSEMMSEEKASEMMSEEKTSEMMSEEKASETTEEEKTSDMVNEEMMNTGEMAIDFTLTSLNGDVVTLSDLKGEKVYLEFWASWCPVCLNGLEEVNQLAGSDNDFKVYTIVTPSNGGEKDKEEFTEWFKGLGYDNIEVLFDETADVFRDYQVRALPTSVYIGTDGVLVTKSLGHSGNDKVKEVFAEIK